MLGLGCFYSLMAEVGHTAMQAPQSMQVPSSHCALSSTMLSALTGHVSTHAPQPMQVSLSILTAMMGLLVYILFKLKRLRLLVKQNREFKGFEKKKGQKRTLLTFDKLRIIGLI